MLLRTYSKQRIKKAKFPEQEDMLHKDSRILELAKSRIPKPPEAIQTERSTNPEKEMEILEEFNKDLHVRRWGELGLIIKKQVKCT